MSSGHDGSYKVLFSHPRLVRDLLMEFVPVVRAQELDFDSLEQVNGSYVGPAGSERRSDLVWKVRLAEQWLYIYLLLEFQSSSDPWMALRMQVYVGLLYQELVRRRELAADGKLPPVLPLVLYNGQGRWTASTDLAELLTPPPPSLLPFQPAQRHWLIDEGACLREGRSARGNLAAAVFRLEHWNAKDDPTVLIDELIQQLQSPQDTVLRRDFALFVSWLLRRQTRNPKIPTLTDLQEVRTMLNEQRLEWWQEWQEEGRVKGLAEGLAEGRLKGEIELLRRLLVQRFGPLPKEIESRLAAATEPDLLRWVERVLEAKSLQKLLE